MNLHELRAKRATTFDGLKAASNVLDGLAANDNTRTAKLAEYERLKAEIGDIDQQIKRAKEMQALEASTATAVPGQENTAQHRLYAETKNDPWTSESAAAARGLVTNKGLILAGAARMLGNGRGSFTDSAAISAKLYGENHPVTKALVAGIGAAGGFIVPPEYINEIIELLRPMSVVRASNPRTMPMPRGTMTLPSQTAAATATYGNETGKIGSSQQAVGQIVASYKKLTALVPVSNDLMRYADPAADAFVRDDLVKVMALREDLAFLIGDGTQNSPRGFLSFAGQYAIQQGGSAGNYLSTGNSTYASGGNFVTSTESYTLATVASELGGLVNKLDTANVPDFRRMWYMHPRSWNYLNNVQNSLGVYVYRDELSKGTLLGYPFKKSTQIPINLYDTNGAQTTCSLIMLVEMTDAMILDSMTLELFISREGTYTDANGNVVSLVQQDETLIRAIAEHDFQMRHPASIAVDQGVLWAPAIS